jgi:hypothetical protein
MAIGEGRHADLIGMSYGDLYATYFAYAKVAVLDQVAQMDDARMAAWKLAQDEGWSALSSSMAGLQAAIRKARELDL